MRFAQTTRTPPAMNRSPQPALANNLVLTGIQAAAQLVGPFPVGNHPQLYIKAQNVAGIPFVTFDVFFYDVAPSPTDLSGATSILSAPMIVQGSSTVVVLPVVGSYVAIRVNGGLMAPTDSVAFRIVGVAQGVRATDLHTPYVTDNGTLLTATGQITPIPVAAAGDYILSALGSTWVTVDVQQQLASGVWTFVGTVGSQNASPPGVTRQSVPVSLLAAPARLSTFNSTTVSVSFFVSLIPA